MEDKRQKLFLYINDHKFMVIVFLYFMVSVILKTVTTIDICLPCIWRTFFGIKCPGGGLTSAFIDLLKLDFAGALKNNRLIYFILPAGLYYLIWDYRKYGNAIVCNQ